MRLLVKPKVKRQLMRIQRKQKIIEPCMSSSDSAGASSDNAELNLAVKSKKEIKHYAKLREILAGVDFEVDQIADQ